MREGQEMSELPRNRAIFSQVYTCNRKNANSTRVSTDPNFFQLPSMGARATSVEADRVTSIALLLSILSLDGRLVTFDNNRGKQCNYGYFT
jgi:hypothetical protein